MRLGGRNPSGSYFFLKNFKKAVQSVFFPRLIGRGSQEKKPSERGDGYETQFEN